jgi:hypothetical protein
MAIWYIFPCFGIFCQEKSGNPHNEVDWKDITYATPPEADFLATSFRIAHQKTLKAGSFLLAKNILFIFETV